MTLPGTTHDRSMIILTIMKKARILFLLVPPVMVLLSLIGGMVYLFTLPMTDELPEVDHSSEVYYCEKEGSVYLEQARSDLFIYVTQYGVKQSPVFDFLEYYRIEPGQKWILDNGFRGDAKRRLELLKRVKDRIGEIRDDPTLRIHLNEMDFRVKIPAFEDPYAWTPGEKHLSFREYYNRMKEKNFEEVLFHGIEYGYSLDPYEDSVNRHIEYCLEELAKADTDSAPSGKVAEVVTPTMFQSFECAQQFAQDSFAGGDAEFLRVGEEDVLIVEIYGSGFPSLGISAYRSEENRWYRVASFDPKFVTIHEIVVEGDSIYVEEKSSHQRWLLCKITSQEQPADSNNKSR